MELILCQKNCTTVNLSIVFIERASRKEFYNGFRVVLGYRDWPTLNIQMASAFLNLVGIVLSDRVSIS